MKTIEKTIYEMTNPNTTESKETTYNKFIGKTKHWEYIVLKYSFDDWNDFKGLTGSSFELLTQSDVDERVRDYDCDDLRKEAVYNGNYTGSLSDFQDDVDESWVCDDSYNSTQVVQDMIEYVNENEGEEFEYSNCNGGGRMFSYDMLDDDYREYLLFPEIKELIKQFETK